MLSTASVLPLNCSGCPYGFQFGGNYTGLSHAGYSRLPAELSRTMVMTRFDATPFFGKSYVSLVSLDSREVVDIATSVDWPNVPTTLNASIFGFPAVAVGAGFLVPSHTVGGVWIMEASADPKHLSKAVKITADKSTSSWKPDSGYFYHKAVPRDMNGDGLADFVTSRAAYSVFPFNTRRGELVWLEQPRSAPLEGQPWKEHIIADGPDFLFDLAPPDVGPWQLAACAAEYIGERLSFIYGSVASGFHNRTLDAELGPGFGCTWTDLNGDGASDLLVTNHVNQNGSVFGYTWSGSLADPSTVVTKHVLASGFSAVSTMAGTASPGDALPYFPTKTAALRKPFILVSADNGNAIYNLAPRSQTDPNDWSYSKQLLSYIGADVGSLSIGDTDGDGFAELYVPAYDLGVVSKFDFVTMSAAANVEASVAR